MRSARASSGAGQRAVARLTRDLVRAGWPGTRVLKSALASGLAWYVAARLGDPAPMFAVFGALNGVQPTVAASVRLTGGALVGIIIGSALAALSETFVDAPRALVVAVLVGLGLLTTLRLRAYSLLGIEVVVTALLVFALSGGSLAWAAGRFGETALGGGIAILINALVLPPDYRVEARQAVEVLVAELSARVQTIIADVARPPTADEARLHLVAARAASQLAADLVVQTERAREALRFSPLMRYSPIRRGSAADITRYIAGVETLAYALAHVRSATRAAGRAHAAPAALPGDWDALLVEVERAVAAYGQFILDGTPTTRVQAETALTCALDRHAEIARAFAGGALNLNRAAVVAETEHILSDLKDGLLAV